MFASLPHHGKIALKIYRYIAALLLFAPAIALADDGPLTQFSRIDTDGANQPRAMQVAIVSYAADGGRSDVRVELVGAVHIADASYYAELNERFTKYDALLYELVAPKGTVITPESKSKSAISGLQLALRSMLNLTYQLDEIDYRQANFVHADLSPDEMAVSMAERGESLFTYLWKIVQASFRELSRDPLGIRGMEKMAAAFGSGKSHPMKVMLAYEFADLDRFSGMFGDDSKSALIGARNERAIEVMQRELDAGKRRVGIFYGAAHMRDLENRLLRLGFVAVETVWLDAWVL